MAVTQTDAALEVRGVTKSFGATKALSDVSMVVGAGTIHGLLGQNGAGKSTLVKIMTGIYGQGSFDGALLVRGDNVAFDRPQDARRLGIGYVPQEIDVAEHLTVTENVLSGHLSNGLIFRRKRADEVCARVLTRLGLDVSPRAVVATLSAAQRQLLMVARALALDPAVLVLDEPTTSLDDSEAAALGQVLTGLQRTGLAVLYITHRVPEVLAICGSAAVLRDGKVVEELAGESLTATRIVTGMAGRVIKDLFPGRNYAPQATVMSVRGLSVRPVGATAAKVTDVDLDLYRGEILGIAGLLGSGRSELLSAVYGAIPRSGTVSVGSHLIRSGHPRFARESGIAMVTEERKREGLLFNVSVLSNITLGSMEKVSVRGLIRGATERVVGREVIGNLQVKTPRLTSSVEHLSGGNQQKLLIARALLSEPRILLLDEPTKGVDVGTRQQIYRLMGSLADQGISLIVASSELDELLGMCDRFLVLAAGHLVDEFVKGQGSETRILSAIAGATTEDELITT